MTRFTFLVFPDGKSIVTTEEVLSPEQLHQVKTLFHQWSEQSSPQRPLFVASAKVVRITSLELDVEPDGKKPS